MHSQQSSQLSQTAIFAEGNKYILLCISSASRHITALIISLTRYYWTSPATKTRQRRQRHMTTTTNDDNDREDGDGQRFETHQDASRRYVFFLYVSFFYLLTINYWIYRYDHYHVSKLHTTTTTTSRRRTDRFETRQDAS